MVFSALGVFVLAAVGAWYWFYGAVLSVQPTEVRFVSSGGEGEITARFEGRAATVTGLGLEAVALQEVETASGARYEDRVTGITLWNKGDEVTLYQNGAIIFTGLNAASAPAPQNDTVGPVAEQLLGVSWIWKETIMSDGAREIPSTPDRFSVTFADEQVTGTTDCNNFSGAFTLAGATLTAGPFRATKMYCAGSTEQAFMQVLEGQSTVLFNVEGNLVLLLPQDAGSVFFVKATSSEETL